MSNCKGSNGFLKLISVLFKQFPKLLQTFRTMIMIVYRSSDKDRSMALCIMCTGS